MLEEVSKQAATTDWSWLEHLPAIGAALGGAIASAWVAFKRMARKTRKSSDVMLAVKAQTEIYMALAELTREIGADRVILLKAHNGGRIVEEPGTQIYITIFSEVLATNAVGTTQDDFQVRAVYDHRYLQLLRAVALRKAVTLHTKDMDEDEMLRGVYTRAGIATSEVVEVYSQPGRYWYLACSWHTLHAPDASERAAVAGCASKVGKLLAQDLFR